MSNKTTTRRGILRGALAGSAAAIAGRAAANPDPLITETQDWAIYTGDPVDATPYGLPIRFEADVIRRNVPWLTADPISSINFTRRFMRWTGRSRRRAAHSSGTTPVRLSWPRKTTA